MTANEFDRLCSKYLINPAIALENDKIRAALKEQNNAEVERLLKEEF